MSERQLLLDSMLHEIEVIKFLGARVPPGNLDYRPSPKQRSTLELLQYLTLCGHRIAEIVLTENWDLREKYAKESELVTLESFAAAMDRQAERLRQLVSGIADEEWSTRTVRLPWGHETSVPGLFLDATIKFLVAYRMQLFLYLKAIGRTDLGTAQCWLGREKDDDA
ncbi:MAG: hypothetical protein O7E54_13440 [Planctomycetota bacterium]|jgi:hypothetical protein|nr:hypothetical protein [Planctomycetota bacterium]